MIEKDHRLLRPFDLDSAKRGEKICTCAGSPREFIAGTDRDGRVAFKDDAGYFCIGYPSDYFMAPLAWVEGKPVYKGDVLYIKDSGKQGTANSSTGMGVVFSEWPHLSFILEVITWAPPAPKMVKREGWVNICPPNYSREAASCGCAAIYASKELADEYRTIDRIACIRIEWEEPATEGGAA